MFYGWPGSCCCADLEIRPLIPPLHIFYAGLLIFFPALILCEPPYHKTWVDQKCSWDLQNFKQSEPQPIHWPTKHFGLNPQIKASRTDDISSCQHNAHYAKLNEHDVPKTTEVLTALQQLTALFNIDRSRWSFILLSSWLAQSMHDLCLFKPYQLVLILASF